MIEVPLYMDQYKWSSVKCCTGTVTDLAGLVPGHALTYPKSLHRAGFASRFRRSFLPNTLISQKVFVKLFLAMIKDKLSDLCGFAKRLYKHFL